MITPKDLLALADELASGNSNESVYRAAIGRAYYAAFHALKVYAIKHHRFSADRGRSAHAELSKFLMDQKGNPSARHAGLNLQRLHTKRKQADYNLQSEVQKAHAKQAVMAASFLLQHCKSVPPKT